MTETTDGADDVRRIKLLIRWAFQSGYGDQADAIATDPEAHRAALAQWFTDRGLDPAQANDPATPPDPVILAEWGPTQGVQPNTAEVWASTRPNFPQRRAVGLRSVEGAEQVKIIAAQEFAPGERVYRETFGRRVNMPVTTIKRALEHTDQAPEPDDSALYDAHALAAFLADLRYPGPGLYSLADLEAWDGPQRADRVDPARFSPEERVTVVEFATRTGKDRSTLSKAVNNPAYSGPEATVRAPERGEDRKFNARELAAFVNSLPGRRGRQTKQSRG